MGLIKRVEVIDFTYEVEDMGSHFENAQNHVEYMPGSKLSMPRFAITIETNDGIRGEYVTMWGGTRGALAQALQLVSDLPGKDSDMRELFYTDWQRRLGHQDRMGIGPVDICLWDLAGKEAGKPIYKMLGGYRDRLPAYACAYHGDHNGMLDSYEAFCDFAEYCYSIGYRAFKHHAWFNPDPKVEAELIRRLGKAVGDKMTLMYDASTDLKTFADALYVGKACDDANYFWYEDPYRDNATSAFAHKKLRGMLKTPLLITEHLRGLEPKADFIMAGGTDFVRADPEYDQGITGAIKIGRMAESFGLDCEVHAVGPAQRHVMASLRNANYYEIAQVAPKLKNAIPQCYACEYSDDLHSVDADGTVYVPQGPGLGVTYDWDWVNKRTTKRWVYEK